MREPHKNASRRAGPPIKRPFRDLREEFAEVLPSTPEDPGIVDHLELEAGHLRDMIRVKPTSARLKRLAEIGHELKYRRKHK